MTVDEYCPKDCVYLGTLQIGKKIRFCDYIGITGHARNTDIESCPYYRPGKIEAKLVKGG